MMGKRQVLQAFTEAGVLQQGHFRLTSGLHSQQYMQCAKIFTDAAFSEHVCRLLAERIESEAIDTVISPALGGILFGYELSRQLLVSNIFAERQDGQMTLRRGFALQPGQRVLVAEDVVTTGGSVREVLQLCRAQGAEPVGVAAVVDRTGGAVDFRLPFWSLVSVEIEVYPPNDCPLCQQGIPVVKPGSRPEKPI